MTKINSEWSQVGKNIFRFFFLYFLLQIVPLDWKYLKQLFTISWTHLYYGDIFTLAHYTPEFIVHGGFYNWVVVILIAAGGTILWSVLDKDRKEYEALYYWLRVILRYRLAAAVIAYGFIKFFPLQSPFPSLSHLNTSYGNFTDWKLFSISLGAAPFYESFLGLVELTAGILLLFRKTATIGAFIIVAFTGNVFLSNVAYEGGEYVYSLYLISIALFLLAYDARRLTDLLILARPTNPYRFRFVFSEQWQRRGRVVLKGAFIFFFIGLYGIKTYSGYLHAPHNVPTTPGLSASSGVYNVSTYIVNHDTLPYSATDSKRWQDVVFEKWATISIRSNREVIPDSANEEKISRNDAEKDYELAGTIGRHYYSYEADTTQHILTLHNKNTHYPNEQLILHYSRPDSTHFILDGLDEHKDSIHVVLQKLNKKYLLVEGRRKSQTL